MTAFYFLRAIVVSMVMLCMCSGLVAPAATAAGAPADYLLMVFIQPAEGREAEFHSWYQEHMAEVLTRPGFVSARRYAETTSSFLPGHDQPNPVMVAYGIQTDDLAKTFEEDSRLAQAARLADPPMDTRATVSFTYEKLGPKIPGAGPKSTGKGELKTYLFVSLNGPKQGQEDAYNEWYDTRHVPDVVATPGFVSGQRYRRSAVQRYSGAQSPPYMVIYTIETDDLQSVFADLDKRHDAFVRSDSLDSSASMIFTCEAIGPEMTRNAPAPVSVEEFEALRKRIRVLEDKDAIWSILSRYSLNVDLGRAESFLRLFTDDCVFATDIGGKINFRRGKEELGEMLAGGAPPKGQHLQLDYHIEVDGDTATAVGYQVLTGLREGSLRLNRAAFRSLTFKRVSGTWLIQEVYTIGIDNEAEYLKVLPSDM